MNIAIAGGGIAGGYLAKLLEQKGISPEVYDAMDHDTRCGCRSCGWGAPVAAGKYLAGIGLDMNNYRLESMTPMIFDGLVANTPLCTLNKPALLKDLLNGIRLNNKNLEPDEAASFDVVVDATGVARTFLPPCRSDLTLPTLQNMVTVESNDGENLPAGVYGNQIPGLGYLWVFPLGEDRYHIGVGGIGNVGHSDLLERFYKDHSDKFSFKTLCSCRGIIRVASPFYSTPFYSVNVLSNGKPGLVVGVGESIGTVSPFTGEGIIYSLECARIFADKLQDPVGYTRSVLTRFAWMKKERDTLDYVLSQRGNSHPRLRDRWRFFRNAQRSGIGLPILEAFKRMGSLSKWVEGPDH